MAGRRDRRRLSSIESSNRFSNRAREKTNCGWRRFMEEPFEAVRTNQSTLVIKAIAGPRMLECVWRNAGHWAGSAAAGQKLDNVLWIFDLRAILRVRYNRSGKSQNDHNSLATTTFIRFRQRQLSSHANMSRFQEWTSICDTRPHAALRRGQRNNQATLSAAVVLDNSIIAAS